MIHASSVAVSREHRRAKTDRLDTELLKRGFRGWLRGERGHCSMARVPTIAEEDAKRPNRERDCLVGERTRIVNRIKSTLARLGIRNFKPTLRKAAERLSTVHTPEGVPLPPNTLSELQRDMARLGFVVSQIREIEDARQKRLEQQPETGAHAMVGLLAQIVGVGVETADLLVHEVLSRPMRDRRAVARYAGLTGSPDESGAQRREQGLARAGNARVRRSMIQLAWRFLMFQKGSALALWYRARTADSRIGTRKTAGQNAFAMAGNGPYWRPSIRRLLRDAGAVFSRQRTDPAAEPAGMVVNTTPARVTATPLGSWLSAFVMLEATSTLGALTPAVPIVNFMTKEVMTD